MLSFYEYHPLSQCGIEKAAALPAKQIAASMRAAAEWARQQAQSIKALPSNLGNAVRNNKGVAAAGAAGSTGGVYLGNQEHASQVPPVRALPKLNAEEFILPDTQQLGA